MLAVGKDFVLARQMRAAGIDKIKAGQVVLPRDLLRAQMLLHRDRIIRTAFHRRVIGDDDAFAAHDRRDAGDDAARRHLLAIQAMRREGRQLEERRAGIDQRRDTVAHQ